MRPAVHDVQHRHGKHVCLGAADPVVERDTGLRGGRLGDCEGDPEDRVGAQPPLVVGAVEHHERRVDAGLILGVEAPHRRCDLADDVLDRLRDALAEPGRRVPVAELDSLELPRRGAGGHRGPAGRPGFEQHLDLDGRVAPGVEDRAGADVLDRAQRNSSFAASKYRSFSSSVSEVNSLPSARGELRRPLDPVREAPGHRTQRQLGVDVQPARNVDRREEHVSQLLEHAGIRLGLRRRLAGLCQSLPQLPQLVVEVGQRTRRVRILEVDRRGAPLELPRVEQRRKRLRDVVEDPLAALLLGLDALPVLPHAARRLRVHLAEDVRVPAHELLLDPARDRLQRAGAAFLEEQREEVGLEEQVAELVLELRVVQGEGRVSDLVGLLDGVRDDRPCRLLPIPGAVAPEALGQALEIEKGVGERLVRTSQWPVLRSASACSRPGTSYRPRGPCASRRPTSPSPCCGSPGGAAAGSLP